MTSRIGAARSLPTAAPGPADAPDAGPRHAPGRREAPTVASAARRTSTSVVVLQGPLFQDPVQPGSLELEAMIQLLQVYMLEADEGIEAPWSPSRRTA